MSLRRSLPVLLAVSALALCCAPQAPAASLPVDSTAVLSGAASLSDAFPMPVGNSGIGRSSVSKDGRFVAFISSSDGLVDGDDDRVINVYVKDLVGGTVQLVSRETGTTGEPSHTSCNEPAISDDGTKVGFSCRGPLDPADTNKVTDVYVRDLAADATTLVSRGSDLGAVGNAPSEQPSLSATGESVAFTSQATNLVAGGGGGHDVFRRRIAPGNPVALVSRRDGATGTSAGGHEPSISDDGNQVAFTTTGNAIDPADTNNASDVYLRVINTGTTVLISRAAGATGKVGNGRSRAPAIAGDGSSVAFESEANNLDFTSDNDARPDIYWRSLTSNNTALVSVSVGGAKGDTSTEPSIDSSGFAVGFLSRGVSLDPADTDAGTDAYVKRLDTNQLFLASRGDGANGQAANKVIAAAMSGDGTHIAFGVSRDVALGHDPRRSAVLLRDIGANRTLAVARPAGDAPFRNEAGAASTVALTPDGRFAAFLSEASGLGLPDDVLQAVVVRDRVTGDITLASRADGAGGALFANGMGDPSISADGRRVAFSVHTAQGQEDVYVRDLAANRTFLASRADGTAGAAGIGASYEPRLDADGGRVAFSSQAKNLDDGDTDPVSDIHVRDLEAGRTILVSRADGPAGAKGDKRSSEPSIDAAGTRVAFSSEATNLGDGDTDATDDVHLRDLSAGTTRLVSANPGGTKANDFSIEPSIDAAGTRVTFSSDATNLLGVTSTFRKVFVRDFAAGTLLLVSRADGPGGAVADADSSSSAISPDGGYVAFESEAANLAPGVTKGVGEVYRRDLAGERTELASRRGGPDGAPSAFYAGYVDISRDGACVSFVTNDGLIGPAVDEEQAYVRAFRADCGDPPAPAADGEAGGVVGAGTAGSTQGPGRSATSRDTTAPVLSGARLSRKRFRVARAATALAAKVSRGAVLRFRSSEAATLTVAIERKRRGTYRSAGALTRRIRAGAGSVELSGRLGKRRMAAGRYRLTLTARDAASNRSRALRLTFTIVRG